MYIVVFCGFFCTHNFIGLCKKFTTPVYSSTQYHVCFSSNGQHCKRSEMCDTSLLCSCGVCYLIMNIFLTMPQKCHSSYWSGLDSEIQRKRKWEEVKRTCWEGKKELCLDILAMGYLSKSYASSIFIYYLVWVAYSVPLLYFYFLLWLRYSVQQSSF